MKADLHMHGPIGFQNYWLKKQGYDGKNLLKGIADICFIREIEICAITSDEIHIPRNSVHDRLNYLKNNSVKGLPENYDVDTLGKEVLIVERKNTGDFVYLVNSQTVRAKDNGRQVNHLVIGSNDVPIGRSLDDTLKYCADNGLISIAEHPLCVAHEGIGKEKLMEILPYIDAIEGHNSQLIFDGFLSLLPVFRNYSRGINYMTKEFAEKTHIPWIATSDAHRIEDAGISYIEFDAEKIIFRDGESFLGSLRSIIMQDDFIPSCNYESFNHWINWVRIFWVGTTLKRDKIGFEL